MSFLKIKRKHKVFYCFITNELYYTRLVVYPLPNKSASSIQRGATLSWSLLSKQDENKNTNKQQKGKHSELNYLNWNEPSH